MDLLLKGTAPTCASFGRRRAAFLNLLNQWLCDYALGRFLTLSAEMELRIEASTHDKKERFPGSRIWIDSEAR
jgi:hypothetical protein